MIAGTGLQLATGGVQVGGAVADGLISSGAVSIGIGSAIAVPLIGAAVLGVTLALNYIFNRPTQKYKVITTNIVNDLEPQLRANLAAYMAGPRTRSSQALALQNFDKAWAFLISNDGCGNKQLDFPGRNCINDRNRGGKWDWFVPLRDPIANDPNVQDDPVASSLHEAGSNVQATAQAVAQATGFTAYEVLAAAAILIVVIAL